MTILLRDAYIFVLLRAVYAVHLSCVSAVNLRAVCRFIGRTPIVPTRVCFKKPNTVDSLLLVAAAVEREARGILCLCLWSVLLLFRVDRFATDIGLGAPSDLRINRFETNAI